MTITGLMGLGLLLAAAAGSLQDDGVGQARLMTHEELQNRLNAPETLRILDVRNPALYAKGHIPGALNLDPTAVDERFKPVTTLDDPQTLADWIATLGLRPGMSVVVYDGQRQKDAARVWWLLTYAGVPDVSLLDGGYPLWKEQGRPTTTEPVVVEPSPVPVKLQRDRYATREQTRSLLDAPQTGMILDARSDAEYAGQTAKTKYKGRIPGACHVEWKELVDDAGRFLPEDQLRAKLAAGGVTDSAQRIVVHCEGGGRASVDAFALERLGYDVATYYHGWGDWGSIDEMPRETGEPTQPPTP